MIDDTFYNGPCACIGPMYGEQYCFCEMKRRGLPLNEAARSIAEADLNKKLEEVFEKHYGQKPISDKAAD